MRTWGFLLGVCLAAALFLFPQSPDAAQVVSVTLCKDVIDQDLVPVDIAEEFSTKAPLVHAIVSVKNAKDRTVVRGAWVSVDAIATPNYEIDAMEMKMKAGDGVLHFSISKPDKDWPTGDYKLEVSIDGDLAAVKTFTIVPEPGAGTSGGPGAGNAPAPGGQGAGGQAPTRAGAPAEAAAGGAVSRGGGSGGMYRHPAGFNFLYPEGWTTKITEDILQLIPPNAGSSPEGPTEVYMVLGESVAGEGIFSAEDPRVVEYMDQQVRSLSPALTLQGGAKPVGMSQGSGAELTWEGTSPRGDVIQARAFVAIMKDHGISLIGIGLKNLLQARDADMRQVFSSFGVGEGENDPAIVGSWALVSTSAIDNQSPFETAWSRAQAVSETQTVLDLRPDGTCTWNSKNQTIVGAGDVWLEDNSSSTSQGRWNAGNNVIYIIWDDNTVRDCMYKLEYVGGKPRLRMACGGKGEVWEPAG